MSDRIRNLPDRTKFQILAPIVRGKKGTHQKVLSSLASEGFVRVRVDGEIRELADRIVLDKNQHHTVEIVVDRLVNKEGIESRLSDSLTTCLRHGDGIANISIITDEGAEVNPELPSELVFSEKFACPEHGAVMEELSPRLFSFNSPYGACTACHGIGSSRTFDPTLIIPDPQAAVYHAIAPWSEKDNSYYLSLLYSLGQAAGFALDTPWDKLTPEQEALILFGRDEPIWMEDLDDHRKFKGVVKILDRQYNDASELQKQKLEQYLTNQPCEACGGKRLKAEAQSVKLGQYGILDFTSVAIDECLDRLDRLELTPKQTKIGELVLKEIVARLQFLLNVGLDYLTLDRAAMTLSGGEAQRIRLATQIGSGLTGVLYVLDEPSIGLHQRDNGRLLQTLTKLRDLGNTLIVVEHDEDTIRAADHLVDIGPGAGVHGGNIVVEGDLNALLSAEDSITGAYLSGRLGIETPAERREGNGRSLVLKNANRNNLKHLDVEFPLGKLVAITGVSGSGKSTLINELLHPALQHHLTRRVPFPKDVDELKGISAIDKVIIIDQSPIGRTPRSNPVTYTGVFDIIREVFTQTIEAKTRGYKAGQFSFNVKGGRCEACGGRLSRLCGDKQCLFE